MNIAVGTKVGSKLMSQLDSAKERIWVLCPYISPFIYKRLKAASDRGVSVHVVTSNEQKGYEQCIEQLVHQEVYTDEEKLKKVKSGLRITGALLIIIGLALPAFLLFLPHLIQEYPATLLPLAVILLTLLFYRGRLKRTVIRTYSYNTNFPMSIMKSPNVREDLTYSSFFAHSKILIIDDRAFVGSFNMTGNGLFKNHEVMVEISDSVHLESLGNEIISLPENKEIEFIDPSALGRMIYREQPTY